MTTMRSWTTLPFAFVFACAAVAACVLDLNGLTAGSGGSVGSAGDAGVGGDGGKGGVGGSAGGESTAGGGGDGGGGSGSGGEGGGGGMPGATITVTTVDAFCADGRALHGRNWREANDVVLQISCSSTPDCAAGFSLAALGTEPDCAGIELAQQSGCPTGVTAALKEVWFFGARHDPAGIEAFEALPTEPPLTMSFPGQRVVALTGGEGGGLTYVLGPEGGGGPTELWRAGEGTPFAAWSLYEVLDLDGYFVVGFERANPVLVMAALPPSLEPEHSWALVGCETPLRVEHHRRWEALPAKWVFQDRVVAACTSASGAIVYATEPLALATSLRTLALPSDVHPTAMALDRTGDHLFVWDDAGTLLSLNVISMTVTGRWTLGPSYAGAALVRLAESDELVLGGPAVGQLTLIQPQSAPSRCPGATQVVLASE